MPIEFEPLPSQNGSEEDEFSTLTVKDGGKLKFEGIEFLEPPYDENREERMWANISSRISQSEATGKEIK